MSTVPGKKIPLRLVLIGAGLGVPLLLAAYFILGPVISPNTLRGDILDFEIVPLESGAAHLWILTNGSFDYVSSTKSPGHYSSRRECLGCKAWLYEYDPSAKKVVRTIKIAHRAALINSHIAGNGLTVYYIADAFHDEEPKVMAWNAHTGKPVMDTRAFTARHPELGSGLVKAVYDRESGLVTLNTKDGRNDLVYSIREERLYPSMAEGLKAMENLEEQTTVFVLSPEAGSNARMRLYAIRAPRGMLARHRGDRWSMSEMEHLRRFSRVVGSHDAISAAHGMSARHRRDRLSMTDMELRPLSDNVFLDGTIYYQDGECAVIIYLNQLGKKADRIMTCVGPDGKRKWTVPQSGLFKGMKIDEDSSSFSGMTFTRNKIKVSRSGDLVVLMFEGAGLMGFDFRTGKQLFTLDL